MNPHRWSSPHPAIQTHCTACLIVEGQYGSLHPCVGVQNELGRRPLHLLLARLDACSPAVAWAQPFGVYWEWAWLCLSKDSYLGDEDTATSAGWSCWLIDQLSSSRSPCFCPASLVDLQDRYPIITVMRALLNMQKQTEQHDLDRRLPSWTSRE